MCDRHLFLFDLDHTLLPFDSGLAWSRLLVERGILDASVADGYLDHCKRYVAGDLSIDALHRHAVSSLLPSDPEILRRCQAMFRDHLCVRISGAARQLVGSALQRGLCAIVTATNKHIAQPAADAFGIPYLIATDVTFRDDGTADRLPPPCHGADKVTRVETWIKKLGLDWGDFSEVHFLSDSVSDLPLFQRATHPTAVHPDARLRDYAQQKGWRIRDDLYV